MSTIWRLLALSVALLIGAGAVRAQTLQPTVAPGASSDITGGTGVCKKITNGCGQTIMVPSTESSSWSAYSGGAKPACVTVADCAPVCAGYSYGGYCYYAAAAATAGCDQVCSTHGGCNLAGTQYIGSAAPDQTRCQTVYNAILGSSLTFGNSGLANAVGCALTIITMPTMQVIPMRYYGSATTCAATTSTIRVCACNN